MRTLMVLLLAASPIQAGGKCFCQPVTYYQPQYKAVEEVDELTIINRQISLSVPKAKPNLELQKAVDLQWKLVTEAIPIPKPINYLRDFQFNKNWPVVAPQPQRARERVQTQTTTEVKWGFIQNNLLLQNGSLIGIDVPPAVVEQISR